MDRKVITIIAVTVFVGSLLALQGVFGQPDTITIENPGLYPSDRYQGVQFPHKKHADALKDCVKCHHTTKKGEKAQKCVVCHTKDSKVTAYKAFHTNCKGCHSALKKEGKATGPTICTKCHAKK